MKTLKYILEMEKKYSKANIRIKLNDWYIAFRNNYPEITGSINTNPDNKRPKDPELNKVYIRGYFGNSAEEVEKNVKLFFKYINMRNDVLNSLQFEYGKFYKPEASDKYNALKITSINGEEINIPELFFNLAEDDCLYVVNTTIGNAKTSAKTFTPDALGLAGKSFTDSNAMLDSIKTAFNTKKFNNVSDYIKEFLLKLCNNIINNKSNAKISFEHIVNHFIKNEKTPYSVNYILSDDLLNYINSIDSTDLNNICNDFGEILGALMFLNILDSNIDTKILYPSASNAPKYDYIINDEINISAKSKGGAASSIRDAMSAIKNLYETGKIQTSNTNNDEKYFLDKIVPILGANNSESKKYRSITRFSAWELSKLFNISGLEILNKYNVNPPYFNGNKVVEYNKQLSTLYKSNKLGEFLSELYYALGYTPSSKNSIEKILKSFDSFNNDKKEGIILYPFKVAVVNHLNKLYHDYISKYISLVSDGYQVSFYLNKKSATASFNIYSLQKHEYVLEPGGDVNDAKLKAICAKIKK